MTFCTKDNNHSPRSNYNCENKIWVGENGKLQSSKYGKISNQS